MLLFCLTSLYYIQGKLYDYWKPLPEDEIPMKVENLSTESPKHTATEEQPSEDFDSPQSEEEGECMEDKAVRIEGSKGDRVSDNQEKNGGLQEGVEEIKPKPLIKLENGIENAGPDSDESRLDDQLLGKSNKKLDERIGELLTDNEPLERIGDLTGKEKEFQQATCTID